MKQKSSSKPAKSVKEVVCASKVDEKSQNTKKTTSTILQEIEHFEKQSLEINSKLLEKLHHDDIKEVYQIFNDLDNEASKEIVAQAMKKVEAPPIEIARIGHRIWTYFYEKTILRIALLIWFFQLNLLKKILPFEIPFPSNFDVEQVPRFLRKILFSQPGAETITHVMMGSLVFLFGFVVIWVSWRIWLAYLESKRNKNHSGSTLLRRNLGIIVVNRKGESIGILRALLRGLFRIPVFSMFMIMSMEYSDYERGLHDKLFKTYVLRINQDVSPSEIAFFIKNNY